MLSPQILGKIKRDFALLLNGADGTNCIISWDTPAPGAVIDEVYQTVSGGVVTGGQTVRCHVNKVYGELEIQKKKLADVIAGDAVMLFDKGVDFTGKNNLIFTVENYGVWAMVEQPPNVFESYARFVVSGESFVQAAYMRRIAT